MIRKNIHKNTFLVIFLVLSCIPILDLLHPGLPLTNDGKDHVARIANFYINLQQGNFIPRWAGNLNWGYGHPILEFLYPLPSYLASLFHFFGFSFIDATKIVFAIGMFASGVFMYLWLAEFLPVGAAFIGGLLYMFTPYRFVELYVRGDLGENLAFVFMPLTLFFIYRLYKQGKDSGQARMTIYGAISLACLILSHNAISLMYIPFIFFYCCYLVYLSNNRKFLFLNSCFLILLGFSLSAFFWIPALLEGKYTLRNIVTAGEYLHRFVSLNSLFYSPWNYDSAGGFTKQLGTINWIILFGSIPIGFLLWKKKSKQTLLISGLFFYTVIAIFLMLPQSQFIWQKVMLLQNFQFPWRFLAIPVFTTSVLGGLLVSVFLSSEKISRVFHLTLTLSSKERKLVTLCVLIFLILFFNKDYWHANGYLYKSDRFFTTLYQGTTDTGESSPIWSIRFMEKQAEQPLEFISGKGTILQLQRKTTKHVYAVTALTKTVSLRENTVYFPGWEVAVDNLSVPIQYQDPHNRGVITFSMQKGKHSVSVVYKDTKLRKLADIISLASILIIIILMTTQYITKSSHLRYNNQ